MHINAPNHLDIKFTKFLNFQNTTTLRKMEAWFMVYARLMAINIIKLMRIRT